MKKKHWKEKQNQKQQSNRQRRQSHQELCYNSELFVVYQRHYPLLISINHQKKITISIVNTEYIGTYKEKQHSDNPVTSNASPPPRRNVSVNYYFVGIDLLKTFESIDLFEWLTIDLSLWHWLASDINTGVIISLLAVIKTLKIMCVCKNDYQKSSSSSA